MLIHATLLCAFALHSIEGSEPSAPPVPHHPHDVIAALALPPNYPEDPRVFMASPGTMNLFNVSTDRCRTWQPSRSGLAGGVFRAIQCASDWEESGIVYVVTSDAGLQVSKDFGKTWEPSRLRVGLRHLAVPPVREDGRRILFTATHQWLLRSEDGGVSSESVKVYSGKSRIEAIAVSPAFHDDQTLFIATKDGRLHCSRDAGETWEVQVLDGPAGEGAAPARHIAFSPRYAEDQTLWLATFGNGVLRSSDGGKTFEPSAKGLDDLFVNQVAAAIETADDGGISYEVFACTKDAGLFRSGDAGASWELLPLKVEKTHQTDNHFTQIVVSPAWPEDKTLFCGTFEGLNVSVDGGKTWRESNVNPPRIGRIIETSPGFATDGTLFGAGYGMHLLYSENRADDWGVRFADLRANSVYAIGASPSFTKDGLLILGVHEGVRVSRDRGLTWNAVRFGEFPGRPQYGYTTRAITYLPTFEEDRTILAIGTRGMLFRSQDAGVSWEPMTPVGGEDGVRAWTTALALSPDFTNDQTLFVGGTGLFRSEDGGKTFSESLSPAHIYGNGLALAPDWKESDEMYAVTRGGGFMIGTDRGEKWIRSNEGLRFGTIAMRLSPDFVEDSTIFVLTIGGGVHRSTDRGRSWERVSQPGSAVDQAFCLALSPDFTNDQTMIVGTYDGFYRSTDGGVSWVPTTRFEIYDDKREPWVRRGEWGLVRGGTPINSTVSASSQVGSSISMDLEGSGLQLLARKGPDFGIAAIELDGEVVATVDLYAPEAMDRQVIYQREDLERGSYLLSVRVTGERNAAASSTAVNVDALRVQIRK